MTILEEERDMSYHPGEAGIGEKGERRVTILKDKCVNPTNPSTQNLFNPNDLNLKTLSPKF